MLTDIVLLFAGQSPLGPLRLLWGLIILVLIGSIIIWIIGALIFFIPAIVIAGIVYFITGNTNYTGLAFLLVALISLVKR